MFFLPALYIHWKYPLGVIGEFNFSQCSHDYCIFQTRVKLHACVHCIYYAHLYVHVVFQFSVVHIFIFAVDWIDG